MANRLVKLKHNDSVSPFITSRSLEPDKSRSISELTSKELYQMLERLRNEKYLQEIIRELKQNSGERDTYEKPFQIDTKTPIDQLYHHGILGMKWGVRRFQNPDGTRTPAGKRREAQSLSESDDHLTSRKAKSAATKGLSNEELRKLNERLQLEDTYKRLTKKDLDKSESWVKKAIKSGGEQALSDFSKSVFLGGAKLLVKEISPEFAEISFNIKEKKK